MLDVHPPEHAAHTWTDFFIHIATIVVGLIIAVGLEQAVEFIHHRHQLYEAREAIHTEMEVNLQMLDEVLSDTQAAQTALERDTQLLQAAAEDKSPPSALAYPWGIPYPRSSAWQDAKASGAVNYMTTSERAETDYIYGDLDLAEHFAMSWLQQNNIAAASAHSAPTIGQLSPQARDQLLEATLQTNGQIDSYRMLIRFARGSMQDYLAFPAESGLQSHEPRTH